VKLNEIESNQGVPGDWVELYNAGTTDLNIGGLLFKDSVDTNIYTIPTGTMITANGYYVLEESAFNPNDTNAGLGSGDSARLFLPDGVTLIDSTSWTAHAAPAATNAWSRCPNGSGAFISRVTTKGAANDCPAANFGSRLAPFVDEPIAVVIGAVAGLRGAGVN